MPECVIVLPRLPVNQRFTPQGFLLSCVPKSFLLAHYRAHAHCTDHRSMNPEDLQRLVTERMPYGKYKGRLLADLPGHYLGWFAREGFPSDNLGQLLALMYELDHNALRGLLDPLR